MALSFVTRIYLFWRPLGWSLLIGLIPLLGWGDQIRYEGALREGTIHPISDETTVYFLETGGRHYVALRRDAVEVLSAPGISNADEVLARARELLKEGRGLLGRQDVEGAIGRYEQADRLLRVIRKPGGPAFQEAQEELARIPQYKQFARDLGVAESFYSNAVQTIDQALVILQSDRKADARVQLEEADLLLAQIQVGPRLAKARKLRDHLERLKGLIEKRPEFFIWPAQYAAASYDHYDLTALAGLQSNLTVLAQDMHRQKDAFPEPVGWFAEPLSALETAQGKIQDAIRKARLQEVTLADQWSVYQRRLQEMRNLPPVDTIPEEEARIQLYGELEEEGRILEETVWSRQNEVSAVLVGLRDDLRILKEALATRQMQAGWVLCRADNRYYPPTSEGYRQAMDVYRATNAFEEGEILLMELRRRDSAVLAEGREWMGAYYQAWGDALSDQGRYFKAYSKYAQAGEYISDRDGLNHLAAQRLKALGWAMLPGCLGVILLVGVGVGWWLWYFRPERVIRRFRTELDRSETTGRAVPGGVHLEGKIAFLEKLSRQDRLIPEGQEVLVRLLRRAAEIHFLSDEFAKGEEFFDRAAQLGPADRSVFLARILKEKSGPWADSQQWIDRVLEYLSLPMVEGVDLPTGPLLAALESLARIERTTPLNEITERMELNQRLALLPGRVPELIGVDGPGKGIHHGLGNRLEIGSDKNNPFRIDEPGVAPHHAVLVRQDDVYLLSPAVEGALVIHQGHRIETPVALNDGDRVRIGHRTLIFYDRDRPVNRPLAWAYYYQGVGHYVRQAWGDCLECLEVGRLLEWSNPALHLLMGEAQAQRLEWDGAITSCRTAVELDGKNHEAWAALGRWYLAKARQEHPARNIQESVKCLTQAIKGYPARADLQFLLATALHAEGRTREALGAIESARQLAPQVTDTRSLWACLKWKAQQPVDSGIEKKGAADPVVFNKGGETDVGVLLAVDPLERMEPEYGKVLASGFLTPRVVASASEAEEYLLHLIPAAIIVEMDLPDLHGLAFCRKIRRQKTLEKTPLILVTSRHDDALAQEGRQAGADDVLMKPFDPQLLMLKIQRLLPEAAVREAPVTGVKGRLKEMNFPELIQVLCSGGKSVAIELNRAGERTEVVLREGEIIHARSTRNQGEEAFYEVMSWPDGDFSIRPIVEFPERTIHASSMGLLMEGARRGDEAGPG